MDRIAGLPQMIYSPSETKAWLESPIGRYLHYVEGWSPKVLGKKELSGVLGSAFAGGVEAYFAGESVPLKIAYDRLSVGLKTLLDSGHTVAPKEELFYDNLPVHLDKLLTKAINNSPLLPDWKVIGSEVAFRDCRCRLDLVVETPEGITFVDYKTKSTLDGFYREKQLGEWGCDWQFMHYTWALKQNFPYAALSPQYHVALVTYGDAKRPTLYNYPLDLELLAVWEETASAAWRCMEAEEDGNSLPIWRFTKYNQFGIDPWYDAVVNARLEPHLMERCYIRHGGREKETAIAKTV